MASHLGQISEKCCSPSLESPIHEFEGKDIKSITPQQPQLLLLSYFLSTSCFSPPSSVALPKTSASDPKLASIFNSHYSDFWRAWREKKPVPPKLPLFCNGLRESSLRKDVDMSSQGTGNGLPESVGIHTHSGRSFHHF